MATALTSAVFKVHKLATIRTFEQFHIYAADVAAELIFRLVLIFSISTLVL